jgi:hypothetical protein
MSDKIMGDSGKQSRGREREVRSAPVGLQECHGLTLSLRRATSEICVPITTHAFEKGWRSASSE